MRFSEITLPATHPHLATLCVTPDQFDSLSFLTEEYVDTNLLWIQNDEPLVHRIYVACSTAAVRDSIEARWG